MQLDCGGAMISSSQSFLKEKFNFSRSLARSGGGTVTRHVSGNRAPVFWLMGNSDSGTYFNVDDLDKMIARNRDAYVLIASLETSKRVPPLAEASVPLPKDDGIRVSTASAALLGTAGAAVPFAGPPHPVPTKDSAKGKAKETVVVASSASARRVSSKGASKSSSSATKKKKRRS
jgi:hypothetical protein